MSVLRLGIYGPSGLRRIALSDGFWIQRDVGADELYVVLTVSPGALRVDLQYEGGTEAVDLVVDQTSSSMSLQAGDAVLRSEDGGAGGYYTLECRAADTKSGWLTTASEQVRYTIAVGSMHLYWVTLTNADFSTELYKWSVNPSACVGRTFQVVSRRSPSGVEGGQQFGLRLTNSHTTRSLLQRDDATGGIRLLRCSPPGAATLGLELPYTPALWPDGPLFGGSGASDWLTFAGAGNEFLSGYNGDFCVELIAVAPLPPYNYTGECVALSVGGSPGTRCGISFVVESRTSRGRFCPFMTGNSWPRPAQQPSLADNDHVHVAVERYGNQLYFFSQCSSYPRSGAITTLSLSASVSVFGLNIWAPPFRGKIAAARVSRVARYAPAWLSASSASLGASSAYETPTFASVNSADGHTVFLLRKSAGGAGSSGGFFDLITGRAAVMNGSVS